MLIFVYDLAALNIPRGVMVEGLSVNPGGEMTHLVGAALDGAIFDIEYWST